MKTIPLLLAMSLCGCTTTPKKHESPLPPGTEVLEDIPMESNAAVTRAADIKAYPVSRYVDPANKEVMHERHVIYRRERPESWRLRTEKNKGILLGPTVGLRNPVALDRPVSQELNAELNRQRIVSTELMALREKADAGDIRARQLLQTAEKMGRQSDEMLEQIRSYNAQLGSIRQDVEALKQQSRRSGEPAPSPQPPDPPNNDKGKGPPPRVSPDVKRGELPKEGSENGIKPR